MASKRTSWIMGVAVALSAGSTKTNAFAAPSLIQGWAAYHTALQAKPLLVKSVTASVLLGSADVIGQILSSSPDERRQEVAAVEEAIAPAAPVVAGLDAHGGATMAAPTGLMERTKLSLLKLDLPRVLRYAFFGLAFQAPWNHYFYSFLDGAIPPTPQPFSMTTGIKVLIDQFVQAPIVTVLIIYFLGLLEGKTFQALKGHIKKNYKSTMVANWKLWIPATFVNLAFCPPLFRVLFLNVVAMAWFVYLSLTLSARKAN